MTDLFIQQVQQRIREAGYPNMEAFAERSGIRVETLTKWMQGKSRPSKKSLEKLATALQCSVQDLLKEKVDAPSEGEKDRTIERLKKLIELQDRLIEKLEGMLARR